MSKRHRWGEKDRCPTGYKSECECLNGCGIIKVSRHEGRQHWKEFWRNGERIVCDGTPACEPVQVPA